MAPFNSPLLFSAAVMIDIPLAFEPPGVIVRSIEDEISDRETNFPLSK
jgi:archaellum biogenesis protein FlaJ (TadC family)